MSSSSSSNVRDILIAKAGEFMQQGQSLEDAGELHESLHLYQRSCEVLLGLLNNEPDPSIKVNIALRLKVVLDKKERVKQEMDKREAAAQDVDIDMLTAEGAAAEPSTECDVVISVENVSIHQILGTGETKQERRLLGKGVLKVLKCIAPEELYLLQLQPENDENQFQFPLTKSIPCLGTSPGYYIFPMPGDLFYGVVFPKEIPQAYLHLFERVLDTCCCLRKLPAPPPEEPSAPPAEEPVKGSPSTDIVVRTEVQAIVVATPAQPIAVRTLNALSTGITVGADKLVQGITVGSEYLAVGAHKGGEFIKSRITPTEEPVRVSAKVSSTVYIAGKLSPVCVAVSKALINSLATLAEEIGSAVAEGLVTTTLGNKIAVKKETPTSVAAKEVGKSSLQAFVNIWEACEKAGRLLLTETGNVTIDIVHTKYGAEAASVTRDGLKIAGNVLETAYNVDQMGVKQIARKAAKHAGTATVSKLLTDNSANQQPSLSLPAPKERLALTDK